jgi:hypothetical protein
MFYYAFLVILIIICYFLKIDLQAVLDFPLYIKRTKYKNFMACKRFEDSFSFEADIHNPTNNGNNIFLREMSTN